MRIDSISVSFISSNDSKYRESVLSGPLWKPILKVGFPIALFEAINHIFSIIDTLMASHISSDSVSTVVYLVQFNNFVGAIGGGLAVGGAILISHAFGEGKYDRMRKIISTLLTITSIITLLVFLLSPFTPQILRITGTPEEFITLGASYFSITMIAQGIKYLNDVFLSIEKIRGRSKTILILNLGQVAVKLSLTALYVYVFNGTIVNIAMATLISYLVVFTYCLISMCVRRDQFSFSFRSIEMKKSIVAPLFKMSLPSMFEKMCFAYGKLTVNKMATEYGTDAVGAAGISNSMSGLLTGWQTGFQDSSSTIMGQIYGAKDIDRTIEAYKKVTILEFSIGAIGVVIFYLLAHPIARFFALSREGYNAEFENMIVDVYNMELLGVILLSLSFSATSILLAIGQTKAVLIINIFRSFLFRVPILLILQKVVHMGFSAIGLTVALSNSLSGILAFLIAFFLLKREKRKAVQSKENA